jgi:hypothetical protein
MPSAMQYRLMLLPNPDPMRVRLLEVPADVDPQEAYRLATGIVARIEEADPAARLEELVDALEAQGFRPLHFMLGPELP